MQNKFTLSKFEAPLGAIAAKQKRDDLYKEFITKAIRDIGVRVNEIGENKFLLHFKIPFTDNDKYKKKGYYDVVFLMDPPGNEMERNINFSMFNALLDKNERKEVQSPHSLESHTFRIFSNSPSFLYDYTYVYNYYKYLIPWIPQKKYSYYALTKYPKVRNPSLVVYYEKSIWWAYFFMKRMKMFNSDIMRSMIDKKLTTNEVINSIMSQDDKIAERKKFDHNYKDTETNIKKKENEGNRFFEKLEMMAKRGYAILDSAVNSAKIPNFIGHFLKFGSK